MTLRLIIRRDADGATEEIEAEVTLAGNTINLHPREGLTLTEWDVLMLNTEDVKELLTA
jgi:hypothetical protein